MCEQKSGQTIPHLKFIDDFMAMELFHKILHKSSMTKTKGEFPFGIAFGKIERLAIQKQN